jgi:hypothetical protein
MEKYLTDSIATNRKHLETRLYNANLVNPYVYTIDAAQRLKDRLRWERSVERSRMNDSLQRADDSIRINRWIKKTYGVK